MNDGILEEIEELQLSLTSGDEAVILDQDKAVISILDIDGDVKFISFSNLTNLVLCFTQ